MYEVTERLCLTEDDRVVPEGDPDGRWLYAIPGRLISDADAKKYGLGRKAKKSEASAPPEPERVTLGQGKKKAAKRATSKKG